MGVQCIAGYVAMSRQSVNIADVYDSAVLQQVHPQLSFLNEVDKRSGYRTKQLLVVPVMAGDVLHGVLQVINSHSDHAFGSLEEDGARQLSHTRGIAMRQRMQRAEEQQRKKLTRYDGLVLQGVLTQDELTACIQKARDQAVSVKHLLMADFHIRPAQIGPALARFFGVAYEFSMRCASGQRCCTVRSNVILSSHGLTSAGKFPDGLLIMCLDPESVRAARVVP